MDKTEALARVVNERKQSIIMTLNTGIWNLERR